MAQLNEGSSSAFEIRTHILEIAADIVGQSSGGVEDVVAAAHKLNEFVSSGGREINPVEAWLNGGTFRRIDSIEHNAYKATLVVRASEFLGDPSSERHFLGEGKTLREAIERLVRV
jgi:hypothetical protein